MQIQENISLIPYTTFGIQVNAKYFVEIVQESDFQELIHSDLRTSYPHIILGNGANILFTKDYLGIVIKVAIQGKQVISESQTTGIVKAGAGENRDDLVMRTLENNRWGLENLTGIPGTVGASPVQNIGAYGVEAKDTIIQVEGIDLETGEKKTFSHEECQFAYRDSIFKHKWKEKIFITAITFQLQKITPEYLPNTSYKDLQNIHFTNIKDFANQIKNIRNSKLPDRHQLGTAGSFFKNPSIQRTQYNILKEKYSNLLSFELPGTPDFVKCSAGQLIELAWLKWYRQGNVGVYEKHALVLINYGWATGSDILALAEYIQQKIFDQFQIHLEPEVIYV
jgi:UDP-N-acetylmuramate dehydrogenase